MYSEEDCIAYVISKNIHRRHLTAEQKRDLIGKLLKANPEKSNRQIATELGRSHVTVGAVREELESTGQIDQLKKTKGKDGKSRPAKKNQTTEKVAGSINGSRPIPEVEAKPSKSNHHLKVLTSGLRNVLAQSWGELAAQIASNNQTMLKAALKNHLSVVKQTCQQLGVTHDYN